MEKELLHVRFEGFTSTFKIPYINTGTLVCAPVPSYSTIVGIISCCLGRLLKKDETAIGFTYLHEGSGTDLETTQRLKFEKGNLKKNPTPGITARQFYTSPKLDIYLDNTCLKPHFLNPVGVPTLGRSQDISWITCVETLTSKAVPSGLIKPTLIPYPCDMIGGRILRYCDYFYNEDTGYVRSPDEMILYQVVPDSPSGIMIERPNLYMLNNGEVIYLHRLGCTE